MSGPTASRRQFLAGMGVAVLGAACTRGTRSSPSPARPGSIRALTEAAAQLSVLGTGPDAPPMNHGKNRVGFILVTPQGQAIQGGSPEVWIAKNLNGRATGPVHASWHPFTAYPKTGDHSPRSPLPGAHTAVVDFPTAGIWNVAVTIAEGSKRFAGTGLVQITDGHIVAGLGTKAGSTPTPVATTVAGIEEICTRTPVDHMHYISLDQALSNGKPTAVSFGTPLLCTSRLCGPVVDEQLLAFEEIGTRRANFIHVEEFLPGADRRPPAPTLKNVSPAFKAWRFQTDPWVIVIDRHGIIRFRSLGPVTAPEIEAALKPLL